MSRGIRRERQVRELLEADGWWCVRAAGSKGDADVVALKAGLPTRMVEVKSDVAGPYAHFTPSHRRELIKAARVAGAEPWLCWWPPRKKPTWIGVWAWPALKEQAA